MNRSTWIGAPLLALATEQWHIFCRCELQFHTGATGLHSHPGHAMISLPATLNLTLYRR